MTDQADAVLVVEGRESVPQVAATYQQELNGGPGWSNNELGHLTVGHSRSVETIDGSNRVPQYTLRLWGYGSVLKAILNNT